MSLAVTHLSGFGGYTASSSGPAAIAFAASAVSSTNATSYTFTAHSIGTASSDRYVAVAVVVLATTITSLTVGGASTTQLVLRNTGSKYTAVYITDAPVTSGTTADVVVNCAGTAGCCGIGTYAITGLVSTTPVHTATTATDNSGQSLNTTADGVAIGVASTDDEPQTWTWTNITEAYDQTVDAGARVVHSGAAINTASTTTITVTADVTGVGGVAIAYVSLR